MDRAEAIKRLEWLRMVGNHVDSVTLGSEDMGCFDMAIAALREQEQSKWISVEERLPSSQSDVLVVAFWHERWQTMIGWRSAISQKWRVITPQGEREPGGVTHWMPLPTPPKEGAEG